MKKAFSLMELAISLVVIGVIIGAVMSAGDLIKSAKSKEFYQSFVGKWISVVNTYYDKSASNLTDSTNHGGSEAVVDGYFDGIDAFDTANETKISNTLSDVGINLCKVINSNITDSSTICSDNMNPFKYKISGEFSDIVDVRVGFRKYTINSTPKNFLVFINVAGDLASNIDRIIDSRSDGKRGKCLAIASDTSLITSIANNGSAFDDTNLLEYTNIDTGLLFVIAIEIDS